MVFPSYLQAESFMGPTMGPNCGLTAYRWTPWIFLSATRINPYLSSTYTPTLTGCRRDMARPGPRSTWRPDSPHVGPGALCPWPATLPEQGDRRAWLRQSLRHLGPLVTHTTLHRLEHRPTHSHEHAQLHQHWAGLVNHEVQSGAPQDAAYILQRTIFTVLQHEEFTVLLDQHHPRPRCHQSM